MLSAVVVLFLLHVTLTRTALAFPPIRLFEREDDTHVDDGIDVLDDDMPIPVAPKSSRASKGYEAFGSFHYY